MSRKPYDELPWWCQLLWPWFGPPWWAEIEDFDAFLAAITREMARQSADLAEELAGDDRPGGGYLGKAGRLTAARHQAEEIIMHEHVPLTSGDEDDGQEDGESASAACQHRDRRPGSTKPPLTERRHRQRGYPGGPAHVLESDSHVYEWDSSAQVELRAG
jgi:hypothetical protein